MTVLEAMERSGIAETTLVLAWIKDAIHHIKSNTKEEYWLTGYIAPWENNELFILEALRALPYLIRKFLP